jgi:hypothetical protein
VAERGEESKGMKKKKNMGPNNLQIKNKSVNKARMGFIVFLRRVMVKFSKKDQEEAGDVAQ